MYMAGTPLSDIELEQESGLKPKKPNRYLVVLVNDDYTPMNFVVYVLQRIFYKTLEQAEQIMIEAHTSGRALCGVFSLDVARTKAGQVRLLAEEHGHPLQCEIEAEEGEE